jgi:hypothetical protein
MGDMVAARLLKLAVLPAHKLLQMAESYPKTPLSAEKTAKN